MIKKADPGVVEEVKWKKPSNPTGVPVWSHDGILCIGEALKNAVRLTFPKGALIKDSKKLFNARLDSKSVRAVDFEDGDAIDEAALRALILEAVRLNTLKVRTVMVWMLLESAEVSRKRPSQWLYHSSPGWRTG